MEKEKILEGVEEAIQKALELEMTCTISFGRAVYTKNKKYFLSTTLKPVDDERPFKTKVIKGKDSASIIRRVKDEN